MKFVLKNARISGVASTNGPGECASSQVTETLKKNKKTLNGDICCLDVDRRSKQTFVCMFSSLTVFGNRKITKNKHIRFKSFKVCHRKMADIAIVKDSS